MFIGISGRESRACGDFITPPRREARIFTIVKIRTGRTVVYFLTMKTVIRIVVTLLTPIAAGFAQAPTPPPAMNAAPAAPLAAPRPAVDLTTGHYSYRVANIMGAQRT
jgi:hypothetical protein